MNPPPNNNKCEATGKSRFKTLAAAQVHRADAIRKHGIVMRIYDCHFCGDWHLTKTAAK